ncbi:MAG: hypothetical protein EOP56_09455 [Sphingobacteriales bacterium]|nr:MAG: hypothetical protein EOP56_09455 [Sphingobacteriales bacterium]
MPQQPNKPQQQQSKVVNDPELVHKIFDVEHKRLDVKLAEQVSNEKQIESHERIAIKQLELQADYLKGKPKQDRYGYIVIGSFVVGILVICLAFLIILLYLGKEEFAKYLLLALSHGAIGSGAYYAGKKKNKPAEIQEPEVVE